MHDLARLMAPSNTSDERVSVITASASSESDAAHIGAESTRCPRWKSLLNPREEQWNDGYHRNCASHVIDGNGATLWHAGEGQKQWLLFAFPPGVTFDVLEVQSIDDRLARPTLQWANNASGPWVNLPARRDAAMYELDLLSVFVYTCRRLIDLCFVYACRRLIDLS